MKLLSIVLNILIRLGIIYFLGEVLLFPDDPRFAGKAIPVRNLIIVITLSLLFPVLYFLKKRWPFGFTQAIGSEAQARRGYPFWLDNLYLSIFWLDMAGNSFNLYDRFFYFDLIPHLHGTGALAAVLFATFGGALGLSAIGAIGTANVIHTLLEIQEYYTDVLFGTHNVRGVFDPINDLAVGIIGTIVYIGIYLLFRKKKE